MRINLIFYFLVVFLLKIYFFKYINEKNIIFNIYNIFINKFNERNLQ